MNQYLLQYAQRIDPHVTEEDVLEIKELNDWDLLITFTNGRKVVFDRFNGYHQDVFYDNVHNITPEQEAQEFAYRLRSLMGRRRISQEELAEAIGTTQALISRYVRGENIPSVIAARKIAKVLNCSIDDLFYKEY